MHGRCSPESPAAKFWLCLGKELACFLLTCGNRHQSCKDLDSDFPNQRMALGAFSISLQTVEQCSNRIPLVSEMTVALHQVVQPCCPQWPTELTSGPQDTCAVSDATTLREMSC